MTYKIQTLNNGRSLIFRLSGQLNTESVEELAGLLDVEENQNRIVLDLKEVTLADRDAVRFLSRYEAQGVKLEYCPIYIREWIFRETASM